MWVLNFNSRRWAQVSSGGAAPGSVPFPTGTFIGDHFFLLAAGRPGSNLWRWDLAPYTGGGGGGSQSTTNNNVNTAGLGAGIAIGVIVNAASLVFIILVWRKGGASAAAGTAVSAAAAGDAYSQLSDAVMNP